MKLPYTAQRSFKKLAARNGLIDALLDRRDPQGKKFYQKAHKQAREGIQAALEGRVLSARARGRSETFALAYDITRTFIKVNEGRAAIAALLGSLPTRVVAGEPEDHELLDKVEAEEKDTDEEETPPPQRPLVTRPRRAPSARVWVPANETPAVKVVVPEPVRSPWHLDFDDGTLSDDGIRRYFENFKAGVLPPGGIGERNARTTLLNQIAAVMKGWPVEAPPLVIELANALREEGWRYSGGGIERGSRAQDEPTREIAS